MIGKFKNRMLLFADSFPSIASFLSFRDFKNTLENAENKIEYTTNNKAADSRLSGRSFGTAVKLSRGEFMELDFGQAARFDSVVLWEKGDNCNLFVIYALTDDGWEAVYRQDRILSCHVCYLGGITAKKIRIEIADCKKAVKLRSVYVYNGKKSDPDFKVSQYLRLDQKNFCELFGDKGFSEYYDMVTDVILFDEVFLNEKAEISFRHSEHFFAGQLQSFRKILHNRPVHIWCCIFFDMADDKGKKDLNRTRDFIRRNIEKIKCEIKNFTAKYAIYGVDYDWEYPSTRTQWRAYDLIVKETAKVTRVSVAVSPFTADFGRDAVNAIEHINLMAYDMFDKAGNHSNSFFSGYDSIRKARLCGFSSKQILLGIPTYGRTTDRSEDAWPSFRDDGRQLGMWDNVIHYTYLDSKTNKLKTAKAYLNSYAQVRDKTEIAVMSGIGGVMIFRAFCDAPFTEKYSLHKAVDEVLKSRKSPS